MLSPQPPCFTWLEVYCALERRNYILEMNAVSKPQAIYMDKLRETGGFCSKP